MTFDGTTKVFSGYLREVRMNSDRPDVQTYDGSFPGPCRPVQMSMQLELMNVKEEYEFDAPDEQ
jgi:hypothetical protein